jgi:segregation and condensation protein A
MDERTIPWWRKALSAVTRGIRSGFGFFGRPATVAPDAPAIANELKENRDEDKALTYHSPEQTAGAAAQHATPSINAGDPATSEPSENLESAHAVLDADAEAAPDADEELQSIPIRAGAEAPASDEVSGHDFSRAEQAPDSAGALAPETAAPEPEATPDPAVKGTGFSPYVTGTQSTGASAPEGSFSPIAPEPEATPDPALKGTGFSPYIAGTQSSGALAPEGSLSPIVPEESPGSATDEEAAAQTDWPHPQPSVREPIAELDSSGPQLPEAEPVIDTVAAQEALNEPVAAPIVTVEPDQQPHGETEATSKPEPIPDADSMPIATPDSEGIIEPIQAEEPAVEPETGKDPAPDTEAEAGHEPESEAASELAPEAPFSPADIPESLEHVEESAPNTSDPAEEQFSGAEATHPESLPEPPVLVDEPASPLAAPTEPAPSNAEPPPSPSPQSPSEPHPIHRPMITKFDDEVFPFSVFVGQVYDGPLDLLLDLIRKQDIDIYDIPIARITAQFLAYVNQLKASDVDTAGEFIYTASLLIHIKSKMLLPRAPVGPDDQHEDPRRELVERLLEHERFKNAAQMLQQKQMLEAATWTNPGLREFKDDAAAEPEIAADTVDLVRIFRDILERARNRPVLNVEEDSVTVGQMIQFLGRRLSIEDKPIALRRLLSHTRSERALIAMFLALLELVRLQAVLLRQDRAFSEIFIKKHTGFDAAMNEGLNQARDDWR